MVALDVRNDQEMFQHVCLLVLNCKCDLFFCSKFLLGLLMILKK